MFGITRASCTLVYTSPSRTLLTLVCFWRIKHSGSHSEPSTACCLSNSLIQLILSLNGLTLLVSVFITASFAIEKDLRFVSMCSFVD